MKLAIISHTEHYRDQTGTIKGWGPTIREINYLSDFFESIIHIAFLHDQDAPLSSLPYTNSNIKFVPIAASGGRTFASKIDSVLKAREIIKTVNEHTADCDFVQLRVPTGIANYLLPYFSFVKKNFKMWVKYAGNWNQENPPLGYRFQRWWLKNNFLHCPVTINGRWQNQPLHCKTFENPCLDDSERERGKEMLSMKNYEGPYTACFVGRIEEEKGVGRILDNLDMFAKLGIEKIHFAGDGAMRTEYEMKASGSGNVQVIFHGNVDRNALPEIFRESHFLLLPSTASEGFPKVIAEGANYGLIPIVSDISSISHYVDEKSGFIWKSETGFREWIGALSIKADDLKQMTTRLYEMAGAFTFENYYRKLKSEIINDN